MGEQNGASTGREHLNRRQALGLGGAAAATVAAASLAASGAATAAEVEAEAEAEGRGDTTVLRSVSLAQANRIVAAAVRFVRGRADLPPMYIVVVDVAGNDKASRRMDGNGIASLALVPAKARTALGFRAPTLGFGAGVTDPGRIASFTTAGFSLLGGGRPIQEADGTIIGAIAVGGGSPEQDDEVAAAALTAL